MSRFSRFTRIAAIAAAFLPAGASALELGEISSRAQLGQTLTADIDLRGVADLSSGDVLVSLAPQQVFDQLGIERNYFLTGLRFSAEIGRNGKGVIHVQSTRPAQEPYLSFAIQVTWPQGRVVREYTLLLDPPGYATPAPARVSPAVIAAPVRQVADGPHAEAARADSYRIVAGDSLWDIAARYRPSSRVSVMQTMQAIQDMNPQAFIDGNANQPKVGAVLRLPDEQQAAARGHAQAVARMQAQGSQRRGERRQLDASRKSAPAAAPAEVSRPDSLRLVSGKASGKAQEKADAERLAMLQENLDSAHREGDELKSRIADLQSQLDKLNKLVELKDAQMAGLVARLAAQSRQTGGVVAPEQPAAPAIAETGALAVPAEVARSTP
ncbi:type IV pilus assembly protein FimV [Pseudomonas panipatensis]|uniref:type IV pilus assembly protein FimV n=1 Tax=Pseudomonas panipatensis TaxID=428992 RepID=UPI0035B480C6